MAARVLLLADGDVGARVLRLLLERTPCPLVGVGLASADGPAAEAAAACPAPVEVFASGREQQYALADRVSARAPDLLLLAWWPFILRRDVLARGQQATLNLHPSLLGHGRGKDPNFWALAEQQPFGVTIHHVTEAVDEGPVAFQRSLPYDWSDTGATLYRRAQDALVELVSERLDDMLALRLPRVPQRAADARPRRRADLDRRSTLSLDAPTTAREVLNVLRARTFPPHPGCRFEAEGRLYEVRVSIVPVAGPQGGR